MNATQKRSLFIPRFEIKPYEYPELLEFKDAIRHSYWLHTEFNFTGDIQDFRTHISDVERAVITKTMLAISQIEVSVKRFGAIYITTSQSRKLKMWAAVFLNQKFVIKTLTRSC